MSDLPLQDNLSLTVEERRKFLEEMSEDALVKSDMVYQLWQRWAADLHIYIISPIIPSIEPVLVIPPAPLEDDEGFEMVYTIFDGGYRLSTSKAADMFTSGMSMYKLYNTIEKMMLLLKERLTSAGFDDGSEVKVAFEGHELAQRKAFEILINFPQNLNVIVTNYDPGLWGEPFLRTIKRLSEQGYGYPSEAPRDNYRYGKNKKPVAPEVKKINPE